MRRKLSLSLLLNQRARFEKVKQADREEALYEQWANDQRKRDGHDMTRNYPLIEDE